MRTSLTHPIEIAEISAPAGGVIGVTFCPGKHQPAAATGSWARNLDIDLDAIKAWGAGAVITLVTAAELKCLRVEMLGDEVVARGIKWLLYPKRRSRACGALGPERSKHSLRRAICASFATMLPAMPLAPVLIANRGYDADWFRQALQQTPHGTCQTRPQKSRTFRRPTMMDSKKADAATG
jgi:hypothetical protein